jgi:hypothetical protein
MKKFLAMLAIAGVMTSCNSKKEEKTEDVKTGDTATTTVTPPPTTDPAPTTGDVPKFADAEVQKYVDDYTAYVKSVVDAYNSKDMTKAQELTAKATEWSTRSTSVGQKLATNPDEAKKFSDYMMKLSKDMQDAMMPK